MNEKNLLLGPVLSFRGTDKDGVWRVTALIGLKADAEVPAFQVDGQVCPAPKDLLVTHGERYLRYDVSCKILPDERTVSYGILGGLTWNMTVPGKDFPPRMAYVSCNGFSDPAMMRKLIRTSDAVWEDLLYSHDRKLRRKIATVFKVKRYSWFFPVDK